MNYRQAPLLSFLILAVAGSAGLALNATASTNKLRHSQAVACQKANELRIESNQRISSHLILRDAAEDAIKYQVIARRASYKKTHQRADLFAYKRGENLIKRIETGVKYHKTELVPCADAADVRAGPSLP